jgi:hypothetical protein
MLASKVEGSMNYWQMMMQLSLIISKVVAVASRKKRYPPVSFTPGMPLFCAKAYSRV